MSDLLPGVDQCATCPNLMRPHRATEAQYPGTSSRTNKTTCAACAARKLSAIKKASESDKAANNNSGLAAYMTARRKRIARLDRTVTT